MFYVNAQIISAKMGKGVQIIPKDSSFALISTFRIQSIFTNQWNVRNDQIGYIESYNANFQIRRARLKFDGWGFHQKLNFKIELGLSPADLSGGDNEASSNASRMILDAALDWNFYKNFSIQFGQAKLPGNRERVISSGNLQFVDRSLLNNFANLDRDLGFQLKHHFKLKKKFIIEETFAFSQGEGRNITSGFHKGFDYTMKIELLPFGHFSSKGNYVNSDLNREPKPKLAISAAYNLNDHAIKEKGQLGDFIKDAKGNYIGKPLHSIFIDFMFKYKGVSVMGEYVNRRVFDQEPIIYDANNASTILGKFYTGQAFNIQMGYLFKKDWELAGRYTMVVPQNENIGPNESEYTIGVSKYVIGHKLKVQSDISYRQIANANDKIAWRIQTDFQF